MLLYKTIEIEDVAFEACIEFKTYDGIPEITSITNVETGDEVLLQDVDEITYIEMLDMMAELTENKFRN